jgi:DNA-binding MarR family transcriptional regulator
VTPRPPHALRDTTGFLLAWVAADAQHRYEAALASVGLTAHEVGVLTLLTEGPRKPAQLGAELEMFSAQMVGVVRHLHEMNLVRRTPHPTDRRAVLVELTPSGRRRLTAAATAGGKATREVFGALTQAELATFHATLRRLARLDDTTGDTP